jgi:hypothetical protein
MKIADILRTIANNLDGATVFGGSLSQQGQSKMCVFIAATNTWYCN